MIIGLFKPIIGMRYIKTAVAVALCILVSKGVHGEYPLFAAIAALLSMDTTITNSFIAGRNRVMGTLVGAVVGLLFFMISPGNPYLCGLGAVLILYICTRMGWSSSAPVAAIVFLAVMLNPAEQHPLMYGLNRIMDTLLGIAVALLVNYILFPYDTARRLIEGETVLVGKLKAAVKDMFCTGAPVDFDALLQEIVAMENQLGLHTDEFRPGRKHNPEVHRIMGNLVIYREIYAHMKMLLRLSGEIRLNADNMKRISGLGYGTPAGEWNSELELDVVYNYHVGRILDNLEQVTVFHPARNEGESTVN